MACLLGAAVVFVVCSRGLWGLLFVACAPRLQEVVQSPGWSGFIQSGRSRLDLTEPDALYYILVDSQRRVYVVVTSTGYPSRLAYRLQDGGWLGVCGGVFSSGTGTSLSDDCRVFVVQS